MSAPGSPNIRIDMNMVGLPPGRIITSSGDTSTLKRLPRSSATASRSGGMPTVAQGFDHSLDDEVGGAEVGLADAEIDDVAALRRQRIGAREYGKGVFLAD